MSEVLKTKIGDREVIFNRFSKKDTVYKVRYTDLRGKNYDVSFSSPATAIAHYNNVVWGFIQSALRANMEETPRYTNPSSEKIL